MREFDEDTPEGREVAALWRWRIRQAQRAGLSQVQAEILANAEVDSHRALELERRGVPPDLIVELLV